MQNLNTKETMARGVIVLNVSEMPQENISVGKGQNYLLVGDNAIWLKKIPDNSIDSIVTDPPAGISFMGRGWDTDKGGRDHWIAWMQEVATECKRVLKPGGHAFVWVIPRTSHWTATAWENAGFEIRDVVAHVFGSGFPKSHNVEKAVQKIQPERSNEFKGIGTALKPAREDWILMRKPLAEKTVAENVLKYGTGGINIDESRVEAPKGDKFGGGGLNSPVNGFMGNTENTYKKGTGFRDDTALGRFPANLLHDNSEEVRECFPEQKSSGNRVNVQYKNPNNPVVNFGGGIKNDFNDSGNASRFFKSIIYQAKSSKSERTNGGAITNSHPTIKPIALMEYLIKMVTSKGGIVLDPFAGSGSTLVAAKQNGFQYIGIEMTEEYIPIINARLGL